MDTPDKSEKKRRGGPRPKARWLTLAIEIEAQTGIDRAVVSTVLKALSPAVLASFDRADRHLHVPGLGRITYRYLTDHRAKGGAGVPGHWTVFLAPDTEFNARIRTMLGKPDYHGERYADAVVRRRARLAERAGKLGFTITFEDNDEVVVT